MKDQLSAIRASIDVALAAVAKKHKLTSLKCDGIMNYGMTNFSVKIAGVAVGGVSVEADRYKINMARFGLPPLGTEFVSKGVTYKTMGMNSTGTKLMCDRVIDDKTYVFSVEGVKALLALAASVTK